MKIFLSHSSQDKKIIRRIRDDLKSHGHEPWFDEEDIPYGGSITNHVSKGLENSEVVLVFLSHNSVLSNWVKTEWQLQFFDQVNKGLVLIIPVLLEECSIPKLLQDKRYADFRDKESYETNLANLLRSLQKIENNNKPVTSLATNVFEYTKELLDELEDEFIAFPVHKRLPIVGTLKRIPRSGKKIRLERLRQTVKPRSIYDHILSVAYLADCLLPHVEHGISPDDYSELARIIAFHELNEVVLGDIPSYTNLSNKKRNSSRIYAERSLRSVPPDKREKIANELIWLFLSEKQRESMETVLKYLSEPRLPLTVFFKMLDKIDPIVATWRYLHCYRGKLGNSPMEFLKKMKDFFENPDVRNYLTANRISNDIFELVTTLQNRTLAFEYYNSANCFSDQQKLFKLPSKVIIDIIEGCPLFFTPMKN
ncbi:MAG: TIR domain-containing protein [Bacteroidales bacterium]|nr:MAG: TIR domain-containing protein [Bacteroidales bacterium]